MKRLLPLIVLAVALLSTLSIQAQSPLRVVASTSIIADIASKVGGDLVEVSSLIPPGADSHTFSPAPRDVATLAQADLVLINGMNLEEGLLDVIEANAPSEPLVVSLGVRILALAEDDDEHGDEHSDEHSDEHDDEDAYIGVLGEDDICETEGEHTEGEHTEGEHTEGEHTEQAEDEHAHGPCDPHVWMNVGNVIIWAQNISAAFVAMDPGNAEVYAANTASLIDELEALDAEIREQVAQVPEDARLLLTNHDFMQYFAVEYDFEVVGTVIPGISTAAEPSPQDLAGLVEIITEQGVRAIFTETSDNTRLAEVLAAEVGTPVQIVTLYSETLSAAEGEAASYSELMRFNTRAIVQALQTE